jgi:hypothetical protein
METMPPSYSTVAKKSTTNTSLITFRTVPSKLTTAITLLRRESGLAKSVLFLINTALILIIMGMWKYMMVYLICRDNYFPIKLYLYCFRLISLLFLYMYMHISSFFIKPAQPLFINATSAIPPDYPLINRYLTKIRLLYVLSAINYFYCFRFLSVLLSIDI